MVHRQRLSEFQWWTKQRGVWKFIAQIKKTVVWRRSNIPMLLCLLVENLETLLCQGLFRWYHCNDNQYDSFQIPVWQSSLGSFSCIYIPQSLVPTVIEVRYRREKIDDFLNCWSTHVWNNINKMRAEFSIIKVVLDICLHDEYTC